MILSRRVAKKLSYIFQSSIDKIPIKIDFLTLFIGWLKPNNNNKKYTQTNVQVYVFSKWWRLVYNLRTFLIEKEFSRTLETVA